MSLNGDCLLATVGLVPDDIEPRDLKAADTLPATFARRMRAFLTAEQKDFDAREAPSDLDGWFDKVAEAPRAGQVAAWISALGAEEDSDLVAELTAGLRRARDHVVAVWPRVIETTPAGPRNYPLSEDDAADIWRVIRVLDDPESLLDELAMYTLTPEQAKAFRTCYPELYAHADAELDAGLGEQLAKSKNYDPGWERESVIAIFRGEAPEVGMMPAPAPAPAAGPKVDFKPATALTQAEASSAPKGGAAGK